VSPHEALTEGSLPRARARDQGIKGSRDQGIEGSRDQGKGGAGGNRGARLPSDWSPPSEVVAQQRSDHPHVDLDAQLEAFKDYWSDQPGARGRKVNWVGTWRNWIRREAKNQPVNNSRPTRSTADQRVVEAQALKAKFAELE
jgi:hypothetical protein